MNDSELHISCLEHHSISKTYTQTQVDPNLSINFMVFCEHMYI